MNLIVDNYYKLSYSSSILYFKFKSVEGIDGDKFIITADYVIDRGEYIHSNGFYLDEDDIIEDASINDMIQFLPHNHPERIIYRKKLIKNLLSI